MSQEIPQGSIVAGQYKIIKTLGRGGFGRAYLAEDSRRFNEHCVLKEFAPSIGLQHWNKAKELFDRECSQLYRLKHDQIPTFRELLKAKINKEPYAFIVQSYIRGLNYHSIVEKYGVLNEGQIIRFMQDILPVLSYIHDRDLIHRDISPDNIICRVEDQKPILIDFGLVRDVSTKYTQMAFTPGGKPYFSPYEQMKGQPVSPSSDLYALAATILFLLTDRKFEDFYTPRSNKWEFRQQVNISDGLSNILIKMLKFRPIDRYQTAAEVIKAIAILPYVIPVAIPINPKDLDYISPKIINSSFTSSILILFHKANIWSLMKSDFAQPIKYIGGGLLSLFLVIMVMNAIVKGIGGVISSMTKPQIKPVSTSIDKSTQNLSSCLKINERLKIAKISEQAVNYRFHQKYPDRPKKIIDPNNINDQKSRVEWCQVAEELVAK